MTALLSKDGKHRFRLERDVAQTGIVIAYFGVNPSTADATVDDQTITKLKVFTHGFGGRKLIVGNVFSLRARDVKKLWYEATLHTSMMENLAHIDRIIADADLLVPCWGSRTKIPKILWHYVDSLRGALRSSGKPVKAFSVVQSGDPGHPLMLGYDTELKDYA